MSKRVIWSIVLFGLAIMTMFLGRGLLIGELIGAFFFLAALIVWIVPVGAFGSSSPFDPTTLKRLARPFLGVGLGLFAAVAAALILPNKIFSWLLILVGIILIVWVIQQTRR